MASYWLQTWTYSKCYLLATDTWHRFLPSHDTSLGVTAGQMLKSLWWLRWGIRLWNVGY